jgi:hypothetical protein
MLQPMSQPYSCLVNSNLVITYLILIILDLGVNLTLLLIAFTYGAYITYLNLVPIKLEFL